MIRNYSEKKSSAINQPEIGAARRILNQNHKDESDQSLSEAVQVIKDNMRDGESVISRGIYDNDKTREALKVIIDTVLPDQGSNE